MADQVPYYGWSVPGGLVERPGEYPGEAELWCYADKFSYMPGESVSIKVHTNAATYDLEIVRDGAEPTVVFTQTGLTGQEHQTPVDAYAVGCDWPEALSVTVDPTWSSGFYLIILRCNYRGRVIEREGFFVVRAASPAGADMVLIHTTSTMLAYNDWGGANHYRGLPDDLGNDVPSPVSSTQRPVARGMLRKPIGAPRNVHTDMPGPGWIPRHPPYEWAWHNGYSRHHADAFWATYERPFVVWAENQGFAVHHITQHDLHYDVDALAGYSCAVIVGHDEYWTWEMRDRIDSFVDAGGGLARFGGNFFWQVRLDAETNSQTCYKIPDLDPLYGVDNTRVTTAWDWNPIQRPAAATMGLTGMGGIYARYGATTPRSSGGFTVYRPDHWALEGSDLYYGDVFGSAPIVIAGFELDGVDYTFRHGLPYATGADGADTDLQIIAMVPAVIGSRDHWNGTVPIGSPLAEADALFGAMYGDEEVPAHVASEYGSGMVAEYSRGDGTVFNAGSCEWVQGLVNHDFFTEKITRNVLTRLSGRAAKGNRAS